MNLDPKAAGSDPMVVYACRGDQRERLEMAAVMRQLAKAIEEDRYTGCAHLVLEARWLARLGADSGARQQAASRA